MALWTATRKLSDEPEAQWCFLDFNHRLLASADNGLDFAYEDLSTWDEVTSALLFSGWLRERGISGPLGIGVVLGVETFDGVLRSRTGRFNLPKSWERFRGRHALTAVGWDERRDEIVVRNSWGTKWGNQGYGYIPRAYFEAYVDCATALRPAWVGPSPLMDKAKKEIAWKRGNPNGLDPTPMLDAWMTPNPIKAKTVEHQGRPHQVRRRMLYTLWNATPFDAVEIREGAEFRGRIHLTHNRRQGVSTFRELWVAPAHRRQGYGSYLIREGEELAADAGTTWTHILLREADASAVGLPRAQAVAMACGYGWASDSSRRPNLVMAGVKALGTSDTG
ncbi:GNAT family N-acetyltransferase [Streptomyces mirabilis]|uniref:GNAT family N-acetyltransferase n=1 Tax=Streptomyces mirabilis TaxID=68239 RepID=UPI0036A753FE